jgi:hypothetical protein
MHENLRSVLAEIPRVAVTILTNSRHVPWTPDGFRHVWADQLASPHHGASKGAPAASSTASESVVLLEAGCTDAEVSAITGQSREMVEHYALQVNQRKLAAAAILKWESATQARTENERDDSL